jgi:VIT1/CCC1 family predicted Fe2+/Mn2+ transporter
LSSGNVRALYVVSSLITGVSFFVVGAAKGRLVLQRWYSAGAETCILAGAAAVLAYLVGVLLRDVLPGEDAVRIKDAIDPPAAPVYADYA